MENNKLLQIMQLADSALPLGGFAFSNGLEWMVKTGTINNLPALESYLQGLCHQALHFDLLYLGGFYSENHREALEDYDAMLWQAPQRDFSVTQGRAWLRLLPRLYPDTGVRELRRNLQEQGHVPHFLYVMVRSMSGYFKMEELARVYLFMLLRDQISAALRLGVCGPSLSQELLGRNLTLVEKTLEEALTMGHFKQDWLQAERTSVLVDLSQAGHNSLYSKLFQN